MSVECHVTEQYPMTDEWFFFECTGPKRFHFVWRGLKTSREECSGTSSVAILLGLPQLETQRSTKLNYGPNTTPMLEGWTSQDTGTRNLLNFESNCDGNFYSLNKIATYSLCENGVQVSKCLIGSHLLTVRTWSAWFKSKSHFPWRNRLALEVKLWTLCSAEPYHVKQDCPVIDTSLGRRTIISA